jgi:hypothetical protein
MKTCISHDFVLREIVYRSSEQIISVKQLQHLIECGVCHTKSISNPGEKLGENIVRVQDCLNR